MTKRAILISFSVLLLALPLVTWAANIPAKVFENGTDNNPLAVSGVDVQILGGFGFKALFSSTESESNGGCLLSNIPLGKEVLVKLTKGGYITQYDIRSYSDVDVENGIILWIGSKANINALYKSLGEDFDATKGHVYLDISDEMTGEGIEELQLAVSSGKIFSFGNGEYLVANAVGSSLKVSFQKPGYAFDIESATIPLFAGAFTQYYMKVQSEGGIAGSMATVKPSRAPISGIVRTYRTLVPVSGVSIAFTDKKITNSSMTTVAPAVVTGADGTYVQTGFVVKKYVYVTPSDPVLNRFKSFKPSYKKVLVPAKLVGKTNVNFKAVPK